MSLKVQSFHPPPENGSWPKGISVDPALAKAIVGYSDGRVLIYDLRANEMIANLRIKSPTYEHRTVAQVAYTSSGFVAARIGFAKKGCDDIDHYYVWVWRTENWEPYFCEYINSTGSFGFSCDGERLAIAVESFVRVFDIRSSKLMYTCPPLSGVSALVCNQINEDVFYYAGQTEGGAIVRRYNTITNANNDFLIPAISGLSRARVVSMRSINDGEHLAVIMEDGRCLVYDRSGQSVLVGKSTASLTAMDYWTFGILAYASADGYVAIKHNFTQVKPKSGFTKAIVKLESPPTCLSYNAYPEMLVVGTRSGYLYQIPLK
jgi:hypothetical protein